ncbi:MAG: DUF4192 domain-containing protein [Candidatus Nanopelagicales bacterium]
MPTPPRAHGAADARSSAGPDAAEVVRIRGPQDLAVAVPYLIGFRPECSLVVVATAGPGRQRVCVTMRVDLPMDPIPDQELISYSVPIIRALRYAEAERVSVLIYPEQPPDLDGVALALPCSGLVDGLRVQLVAADFEVVEALCVVADGEGEARYWSYLCRDDGCCSPQGRLTESSATTRVGFAFVSNGRSALPSRAELVRSLSPAGSADPERAGVLAGVCELERATRVALGPDPSRPGADRARCAWRADLARQSASVLAAGAATVPALALTVAQQALLLVALSQVCVRDLVLAEAARRDELVEVVDQLTPVVRRAPAGLLAPVATSLALCAYLHGDGALAWVALDRAREDDPDYSLATLLARCLAGGVGPARMQEAMRSLPPVSHWDGGPVGARRGRWSYKEETD